MKRTTGILVLLFTVCLAIGWAGGPMIDGNNALQRDNDLSDVRNFSTARDNLDVYSKDESDALAAQSTLRYYLNEAGSGLATGGKDIELTATAPIAVQASEPYTLTTDYTLADQWVTPTGTPRLTTLVTGSYEVVGYFSKEAAPTVTCVYELWVISEDGSTGTFVATSSAVTLPSGTVTQQQTAHGITVSAAVTTLATDRLLLKLYAKKSAVQAPNFTIWYGSTTSSYFGVPISPRNFLRTDGSNAVVNDVVANLGVASAAGFAAHETANSSVHGCTTVASEATISTHEINQSTHGCAVIGSAAALTSHEGSNSTHGATSIASQATVDAHTGSNAVHGCTNVASQATIDAHAGSNSTHGCTNIASAAAVALKADLAGSSGQAFAADEIQADTYRSASGASTAIALSAAGQMTAALQSRFNGQKGGATDVDTASLTVATFTSEAYDTQNELDYASGVFTAKETGLYILCVYVSWESNATGRRLASIYAGGEYKAVASQNATDGDSTAQTCTCLAYLTAGQTADVRLFQTSGDKLGFSAYFRGAKIN